MTPASLVGTLMAAGMDPAETHAKHVLYGSVLDRYTAVRNQAPDHGWWIPGRLEVLGKHTDYAGGRTLVCAVPRGFAVAAGRRDDAVVRVVDAKRGEELCVNVAEPPVAVTGWRRYADVTVRRMARNFPGLTAGADIVAGSDLPSASGMSSSSALIVAVAVALGRIARIHDHPAWIANIHSPLDAAGYYACIENGRRFKDLEGDGGVGTHGGSEDHTAIVDARPGCVSAYAFVPPRAIASAQVPDDWQFVIAPSGVAARKTGEAKIPYNRLSAGVSRLLETWNRQAQPSESLAAALRSDPHAYEKLRDLCAAAATDEAPAWWLRERLDHFVREDARIEEALSAFASGDAAAIGELAEQSQYDAETLLRNQVPATSDLAASARGLGAFAACSFGAGFGGAVWALVPAADAGAFARRWHAGAFVMRPGPAVTEVSSAPPNKASEGCV